jgi:hypothetical protein
VSRTLNQINLLVVHHSGSPRNVTTEQIRHWHVDGKGWSDIGYHYVIEGDATTHNGRHLSRVGAHCKGHNNNSAGVCVVGNNTIPEDKWTMLQIAALMDLIYAFRLIFPGIQIVGHKDLGATACPGLDVSKLLKDN